ncbi:hypothetical protein PSACC_00470 [Paramicrosporidium saccamoebae]|uniref:Uncharacterized protein n=1 Tax=Paramicrosporidium saccamoebae TaxID=1246581 RepID=A0A2H9TPP1_9FUNG|nr:hypothetical protein PSACC_00470 [Paramicrosporidium saccamoebae]
MKTIGPSRFLANHQDQGMLLACVLLHVASGLQITLTMTKYYALGSNGRREIMHHLNLTNPDTLKALPGILNSTDPFSVKDDFYTRSLSQSEAAALFGEYFDNPQLHPLLFPVSFALRERHLCKLLGDRYEEYTPRYIEYDEDQFKIIPTGLRNRLLGMFVDRPSMLKSRIGMIPHPHSRDLYWNAEDAWERLSKQSDDRLAIISLMDPSSYSDDDVKLTMETAKYYIGEGKFAKTVKRFLGKNPLSAHRYLYSTLAKRFSNRPEMLAFWHTRLVYSILSLRSVNFQDSLVKDRAAMLVKWLLAAYNLELIPPMYLGKVVQILARNKIQCDMSRTSDYARGLAYAQEFAPTSASIWGGYTQAIKQWGIFLHQNFGGIRWPSSINTVEEAEEFWGDYKGNLKHAIPAFSELPYLIDFPSTVCDTVECLVEESIKLYESAGKWSDENVLLNPASTRLWATLLLHTKRISIISREMKFELFQPGNALGKILATSNFFDYISEKLLPVNRDWLLIGGIAGGFTLVAIVISYTILSVAFAMGLK